MNNIICANEERHENCKTLLTLMVLSGSQKEADFFCSRYNKIFESFSCSVEILYCIVDCFRLNTQIEYDRFVPIEQKIFEQLEDAHGAYIYPVVFSSEIDEFFLFKILVEIEKGLHDIIFLRTNKDISFDSSMRVSDAFRLTGFMGQYTSVGNFIFRNTSVLLSNYTQLVCLSKFYLFGTIFLFTYHNGLALFSDFGANISTPNIDLGYSLVQEASYSPPLLVYNYYLARQFNFLVDNSIIDNEYIFKIKEWSAVNSFCLYSNMIHSLVNMIENWIESPTFSNAISIEAVDEVITLLGNNNKLYTFVLLPLKKICDVLFPYLDFLCSYKNNSISRSERGVNALCILDASTIDLIHEKISVFAFQKLVEIKSNISHG